MIIDPNNPSGDGRDPEQPEPTPKPQLPPYRTFVVKFSFADGRDQETIACHSYSVEEGGAYLAFVEYAYMDAEQTRVGGFTRRLLANVIDVTEVMMLRPGQQAS